MGGPCVSRSWRGNAVLVMTTLTSSSPGADAPDRRSAHSRVILTHKVLNSLRYPPYQVLLYGSWFMVKNRPQGQHAADRNPGATLARPLTEVHTCSDRLHY